MSKKYFLILIVSVLPWFACAKGKTYGDIQNAEYIRTYDGDTVFFNLPDFHPILGTNIGVRVRGVDTPEIRGKCKKEKDLAQDAKLVVQSVLEHAKSIQLINIGRGKYFRIVADVVADGQSLATLLLEKGLAVKYSGGKKTKGWCE